MNRKSFLSSLLALIAAPFVRKNEEPEIVVAIPVTFSNGETYENGWFYIRNCTFDGKGTYTISSGVAQTFKYIEL